MPRQTTSRDVARFCQQHPAGFKKYGAECPNLALGRLAWKGLFVGATWAPWFNLPERWSFLGLRF